MKYCDVLQRAMALVLSLCLLLSLSGCGKQSEQEPSEDQTSTETQDIESQTVQNTEPSYREYNPADFGRKEVLVRTLKSDKDQQTALAIYNLEGEEGGRGAGQLFKTLFVDLEGNSGFDVTYIDTVGTERILRTKQFYYKVEVEDIETFRSNVEWWTLGDHKVDTSDWKTDDEIYLQCDLFPPDEKVQFYFRPCLIIDEMTNGERFFRQAKTI